MTRNETFSLMSPVREAFRWKPWYLGVFHVERLIPPLCARLSTSKEPECRKDSSDAARGNSGVRS